ncbi:VOC family protein [Candidatus Woesearchaeota archaeon]|nr:VOC family protein [Candidatus Woesearchaeota archaeon]
MFSKLDYIMLHVNNMEKSANFYHHILGFPVKFKSDGWSELDTGTTTIALHFTKETVSPSKFMSFGFIVDNIQESFNKLVVSGAKLNRNIEEEGDGILMASFQDPDGHVFWIAQQKK